MQKYVYAVAKEYHTDDYDAGGGTSMGKAHSSLSRYR